MAIITNITRQVEIPHEPGEHMTFRRLSWRQLEQASDKASESALTRIKAMGGDLLKAIQGAAGEQAQDPAATYDRATILNMGIVAWSYDDPVTPENIDLLDEETAAWAFREILALNAPRTEADRKNG